MITSFVFLGRLSAHRDIQPLVVSNSCIQSLNRLVLSPSPLIRKYATMVICNVSSNPNNQNKLAEQGAIGELKFFAMYVCLWKF